MVGSGLRNKKTKTLLPLKGILVNAHIRDFVAQVTVSHKYTNNETKSIETIFVFPINSRCIVTNFQVSKENKQNEGKIGNKETNRENYEDRIAEGNNPIKLEQENNDLLILNVGNLQPKEKCVIGIIYTLELDVESKNSFRFHLPQSIYPKHVPLQSEENFYDSELSFQKFTKTVPYGTIFEFKFKMKSEIENITSINHKINPKIKKNLAKLRIIPNENEIKNDLNLIINLKKEIKSGSMIGISTKFLQKELKKEEIKQQELKKQADERIKQKDNKEEKTTTRIKKKKN